VKRKAPEGLPMPGAFRAAAAAAVVAATEEKGAE
jgi:hypothetical protein